MITCTFLAKSENSTKQIVKLWKSQTANHRSGISNREMNTRQFNRDKDCLCLQKYIDMYPYVWKPSVNIKQLTVWHIPRCWNCIFFWNIFQTLPGYLLSKLMLMCVFSNICFELMLVINCPNLFCVKWKAIHPVFISGSLLYSYVVSQGCVGEKDCISKEWFKSPFGNVMSKFMQMCALLTYVSYSCWSSIVYIYFVWNNIFVTTMAYS